MPLWLLPSYCRGPFATVQLSIFGVVSFFKCETGLPFIIAISHVVPFVITTSNLRNRSWPEWQLSYLVIKTMKETASGGLVAGCLMRLVKPCMSGAYDIKQRSRVYVWKRLFFAIFSNLLTEDDWCSTTTASTTTTGSTPLL